jgi:hypothetical protein
VEAQLALLGEVAAGAYGLVPFLDDDVNAAIGVIEHHRDLGVGLADASIVVLAGRLGTERILTLDERRFRAMTSPVGRSFFFRPTCRQWTDGSDPSRALIGCRRSLQVAEVAHESGTFEPPRRRPRTSGVDGTLSVRTRCKPPPSLAPVDGPKASERVRRNRLRARIAAMRRYAGVRP